MGKHKQMAQRKQHQRSHCTVTVTEEQCHMLIRTAQNGVTAQTAKV